MFKDIRLLDTETASLQGGVVQIAVRTYRS